MSRTPRTVRLLGVDMPVPYYEIGERVEVRSYQGWTPALVIGINLLPTIRDQHLSILLDGRVTPMGVPMSAVRPLSAVEQLAGLA